MRRGETCVQSPAEASGSDGRRRIRRRASAGGPGWAASLRRRVPPAHGSDETRPARAARRGRGDLRSPAPHLTGGGSTGPRGGAGGARSPRLRCKRDHRGRGRSASAGPHRSIGQAAPGETRMSVAQRQSTGSILPDSSPAHAGRWRRIIVIQGVAGSSPAGHPVPPFDGEGWISETWRPVAQPGGAPAKLLPDSLPASRGPKAEDHREPVDAGSNPAGHPVSPFDRDGQEPARRGGAAQTGRAPEVFPPRLPRPRRRADGGG